MDKLALLLHPFSSLDILNFWDFGFHIFPSVQNNTTSGTKVMEGRAQLTREQEEEEEEEICMAEMNIVMHRLGIEECDENVNIEVGEFKEIFVDEEPSLSEIEQVFDVFDVNGDGFIDATELQRVLGGLSMKEGYKLEECGRMICAFDCNGDGLLDFDEFVLVMENSFSA